MTTGEEHAKQAANLALLDGIGALERRLLQSELKVLDLELGELQVEPRSVGCTLGCILPLLLRLALGLALRRHRNLQREWEYQNQYDRD